MPPLAIAPVKHQVGALRRFKLGVRAVSRLSSGVAASVACYHRCRARYRYFASIDTSNPNRALPHNIEFLEKFVHSAPIFQRPTPALDTRAATMPPEPPLSPHAINQYIRAEITKLLQAHNIYELESYGWIDAYNEIPDPELVGHAMQERDSFAWRFLLAAADSPSPPHLQEWEKALVIAGGDFEGLMEAARLSIGLMLYQDSLVGEDASAPDSFFAVHLIAAMLLLGTASDRLRDFFISAVFQKITERPRRGPATAPEYYTDGMFLKQGDRSRYVTPFNEALYCPLLGHADPIGTSAAALPALAERLENFRLMRHDVVHVLATEKGKQHQRLVRNPPSAHDDDVDFEITDEMLKEATESADAEHHERIFAPIRWYQLLVEGSHHVFVIENTLRRLNRVPAL